MHVTIAVYWSRGRSFIWPHHRKSSPRRNTTSRLASFIANFFTDLLQGMSALVNARKMTSGTHAGYYQPQSMCNPANPQEYRTAAGSGADVYSMYRISKSDAHPQFTQGTGLLDVDSNFVYLPIINEETKTVPRKYLHAMLTGDLNSSPSESWCPAYIDPCVAHEHDRLAGDFSGGSGPS